MTSKRAFYLPPLPHSLNTSSSLKVRSTILNHQNSPFKPTFPIFLPNPHSSQPCWSVPLPCAFCTHAPHLFAPAYPNKPYLLQSLYVKQPHNFFTSPCLDRQREEQREEETSRKSRRTLSLLGQCTHRDYRSMTYLLWKRSPWRSLKVGLLIG